MNTELFNKGLPKWPALVVKGKPVTPDQAKEIIVRTDGFYFSCNDREWEKEINDIIYGIREGNYSEKFDAELKKRHGLQEKDWNGLFSAKDSYLSKYKPVSDINYLNNHRIASSWIGGPHGWCSWNGRIGCSNYNIGKWPSIEEVYREWVSIAVEFPFLELKCQLMNSEAGEDENPIPVVEFEVKGGKVDMYEPKEILDYPVFGTEDIVVRFSDPNAERGCSLQTLKEAFKFVEEKIKVDEQIKNGIWISPEEKTEGVKKKPGRKKKSEINQ